MKKFNLTGVAAPAPRFEKINKCAKGVKVDIPIQSPLGHSYPLKNPNDMERIVRFDSLPTLPFKMYSRPNKILSLARGGGRRRVDFKTEASCGGTFAVEIQRKLEPMRPLVPKFFK